MRNKTIICVLTTILVMAGGLGIGLRIATHKALWLDEIFSQTSSVEPRKWLQIWDGTITEGNNSPLFYTIQKTVCLALNYHSTDLWHQEEIPARVILRLAPVFFMALGLALLTGYFLKNEGAIAGGLAAVLFFTSYMVWIYWAEARPYSMIFCGTIWQALALHQYLKSEPKERRLRYIVISHFFLALTSALSIIQLTASALILWAAGARRKRDILLYALIPMAIALFYYSKGIHHRLWFAPYAGPTQLLLSNIPSGRLLAIVLFPLALFAFSRLRKSPVDRCTIYFTAWTWLNLAGYILLLVYMKINSNPQAEGSAEVSGRYFITLTPVGIMGLLVLWLALWRMVRQDWLKWPVLISFAAIVLPRIPKAFSWAAAYLKIQNPN